MDKKKLTKRMKTHSFFILSILLCWYFYHSTGKMVFSLLAVSFAIIYVMFYLMGLLFRGSALTAAE